MGPDPDLIVADIRGVCGERHDERTLQLAMLAAFVSYAWLPTDHAAAHPDPLRRAQEQVCLDWWIDRAEPLWRWCGRRARPHLAARRKVDNSPLITTG
jgi:hypothetical protein